MKILILWASLADYTVACFKELSLRADTDIMLIYQPVSNNAPFHQFDLSFCSKSICYEPTTSHLIKELCIAYEPNILLMASWNYSSYMKIAKTCRKKGTKVISAFDNQWNNTLKQNIGKFTSSLFLKPAIDNFLVPGDRQAVLARKLGYPQPLFGFYCANSNNFKNIRYNPNTKRFLFIGRLIDQKGVRNLLSAYQIYRKLVSDPWELVIAGKGELSSLFDHQEGVILKSFVQPKDLPRLMEETSCFVLPSLHENWGLVIHEAALAGLPIICTHQCGASTWFLRDGQNGYLIDTPSERITNALIQIHNKSCVELKEMSANSISLSNLWTIEKWAKYIHQSFIETLSRS